MAQQQPPFFSRGYISSIKDNNLTPWYETTEADEVIEFLDENGELRHVNSLVIRANSMPLYVKFPSSGNNCVYVPSNDFVTLDYIDITQITVLGNAGQDIRWMALYF